MSRKFAKPYIKMYKIYDEPEDYFWAKYIGNSSGTIFLRKEGLPQSFPEWSVDKINWYDVNNYSIPYLQPNEKVWFRSTGGFSFDSYSYWYTQPSGDFAFGGNLATLIDWQNMSSIKTIPDYCFYYMFGRTNNVYVKDISEITLSDTITSIGYYSMYKMFYSTRITSVSLDLSSVKNIGICGMQEMFSQCQDLENTSIDLSSLKTISQQGMEAMFQNVQKMTDVSINLSSLETIGEKGMSNMFNSSIRLTKGIDLSNVTTIDNEGLYYMYSNCYKLEDVTAPNIDPWDTDKTYYWLISAGDQVSGTKTVNCPTGVTIPTNHYSGIPVGWVRVDY